MQNRENALLLFAKLPVSGQVKTRLSVLKDGVFSPEDASELFEAMLLDVIDICLASFDILKDKEPRSAAVKDGYKLYISTAPASNLEAMRALVEKAGIPTSSIRFISDSGASFDEHYNDAFNQVWEDGADCILSMGADMPALSVWDIVRGFEALHSIDDGGFQNSNDSESSECKNEMQGTGIVISPDQAMGVSIIGWTSNTDFDHTGIYYNETGLTALPAYIYKAREAQIPVVALPPIPDVDTIADLAHSITLLEFAEYASRFDGSHPASRTIAKLKDLGCFEVRVPPNELRDSRDVIDS